MRILYYCPEYYSSVHGGRTHAREFMRALKKTPGVSKADVWHDGDAQTATTREQVARNSLIPKDLKRFIRFFKPRYHLTQQLCRAIEDGGYNCLIIRVAGHRNIVLKKIKRCCPAVSLCVEINALRFQEEFPNIWFRGLWQKIEVRRFRYADKISVVSKNLKEYLQLRGIAGEKIIVNPNGVNEDIFNADRLGPIKTRIRTSLEIPEQAFVLGYVGGMERFRRLPEVVEHVAAMRRRGNTRLFLLLIGDGDDMPAVLEKIRGNADALDGWVKLVGWVEYKRVPEMMSSFDAAILPFTQAYCSPLKLFEYMALGVVTLGPDVPAVKELFEDGEHIRLITQDGGNFESVVTDVMRSDESRVAIGKRGKEYVLKHFTWKENAQRVVAALQATVVLQPYSCASSRPNG